MSLVLLGAAMINNIYIYVQFTNKIYFNMQFYIYKIYYIPIGSIQFFLSRFNLI